MNSRSYSGSRADYDDKYLNSRRNTNTCRDDDDKYLKSLSYQCVLELTKMMDILAVKFLEYLKISLSKIFLVR